MQDHPTRLELLLRRRPAMSEVMPDFNAAMVAQLMAVPGFWDPAKSAADAPLYMESEAASLDLRKPLCPGLQGQISYAGRLAGYLKEDKAMNDDFASIFISDSIDYRYFCVDVVPRLIAAFDAYRGQITLDRAVSRADHAAMRARHTETDRDIDGRDSVYRFWPVSYADDLLCRRAFGLTAAEVVRRATPGCERAELLEGGAFLIVTAEIVTDADALNEIDVRVKNLLRS